MKELGLIIKGYFCGCDERAFIKEDGSKVVSYTVLISASSDFFRITAKTDYRDLHTFGDEVTFSVRPRIYNGNIYWSGEEIES